MYQGYFLSLLYFLLIEALWLILGSFCLHRLDVVVRLVPALWPRREVNIGAVIPEFLSIQYLFGNWERTVRTKNELIRVRVGACSRAESRARDRQSSQTNSWAEFPNRKL